MVLVRWYSYIGAYQAFALILPTAREIAIMRNETGFTGAVLAIWLLVSPVWAGLPTPDEFVALCRADDQAASIELLRSNLSIESEEMIQIWLTKQVEFKFKKHWTVPTTPLHVAAYEGNLPMVQFLLGLGVSVDVPDQANGTPLASAIDQGNLPVVQFLLGSGASATTPNSRISGTPMFRAAQRGHVEVMRLLLSHGAPMTGIGRAAEQGHLNVVRFMLENGVSTASPESISALHAAASSGQLEVMRLLLASGVSVAATDKNGETALHAAAEWDQTAAVQLLLESGADTTAQNSNGQTPLDLANSHATINLLTTNQTSSASTTPLGAMALSLTLSEDGISSHLGGASPQ